MMTSPFSLAAAYSKMPARGGGPTSVRVNGHRQHICCMRVHVLPSKPRSCPCPCQGCKPARVVLPCATLLAALGATAGTAAVALPLAAAAVLVLTYGALIPPQHLPKLAHRLGIPSSREGCSRCRLGVHEEETRRRGQASIAQSLHCLRVPLEAWEGWVAPQHPLQQDAIQLLHLHLQCLSFPQLPRLAALHKTLLLQTPQLCCRKPAAALRPKRTRLHSLRKDAKQLLQLLLVHPPLHLRHAAAAWRARPQPRRRRQRLDPSLQRGTGWGGVRERLVFPALPPCSCRASKAVSDPREAPGSMQPKRHQADKLSAPQVATCSPPPLAALGASPASISPSCVDRRCITSRGVAPRQPTACANRPSSASICRGDTRGGGQGEEARRA